jgi:hypothetical protein
MATTTGYDLGTPKNRWDKVYVNTANSLNGYNTGDIIFENGMKMTEDNQGLNILNTKGVPIVKLDKKHISIAGKIYKLGEK